MSAHRFPPPQTREQIREALGFVATAGLVNVCEIQFRVRLAMMQERQRQAAMTATLARALSK